MVVGARLECVFVFLSGARHLKMPLRRSESFPNFMTVGALAIWGDACRRIPAGAEGGGGEVARAELAPRARTTPRLATGAQYNVRPEPPPKGHGVGFRFSGPNLKF